LWAIGYDDIERANQVREEIVRLGWGEGRAAKYLILLGIAVVVRHPDGSFTVDHKRFPAITNLLASTTTGFLAGLMLGTPLTGATVGAVLGGMGSVASASYVGIGDEFIQDVQKLMKPGTSALFVLDDQGDLEAILRSIQGLGGTVIKTNVDPQRINLIQSALAANPKDEKRPGGRDQVLT
jgi:uncharacterized membrane protein